MAHATATATSESVRHSILHSVNNTIWTKSAGLRPTPIPADIRTDWPNPAATIPATNPATITNPALITTNRAIIRIRACRIRASTICGNCGAWTSISIRRGFETDHITTKSNWIESKWILLENWQIKKWNQEYVVYARGAEGKMKQNKKQFKNRCWEQSMNEYLNEYIWMYPCETYFRLANYFYLPTTVDAESNANYQLSN